MLSGMVSKSESYVPELINYKRPRVCAWAGCIADTGSWRYPMCHRHFIKIPVEQRDELWNLI